MLTCARAASAALICVSLDAAQLSENEAPQSSGTDFYCKT